MGNEPNLNVIFHKVNTMDFSWVYDHNKVNWGELSELYRIAPLGEKSPEDLTTAFSNSKFKCFVYSNNMLVGAGRALADGADCSYICDVAVHPEYQGLGLGKKNHCKVGGAIRRAQKNYFIR